jgi:hypothetical protein
MAVLFIEEFTEQGFIGGGPTTMGKQPSIAVQTVAIGGTSEQSDAFDTATRVVRLHTDAICSYRFGADPTASATTPRMAAGQTEYFSVQPGHKVAVITNT